MTETPKAKAKSVSVSPPAEAKKKRRFPYRKVADIEADIFNQETRLESLHEEMADPGALRDGARVRRLQAAVEETKTALASLYEHWEEATELNW